MASKWKFKNEILDFDYLANQINNSQSVVVVRPANSNLKEPVNDQAIFGKKKQFSKPREQTRATAKEHIKNKLHKVMA